VDRGVHEIVGRAWSGHAPIVRVEVSSDGGTTWDDATLGPEADRYAWRPWHWAWAADATGLHMLCARATDAAGNTQPVEQRWNRQAMANNHVQRVTVVVRPQRPQLGEGEALPRPSGACASRTSRPSS
jgi:sulfane dehydrogenase subunit SoxC